jgi:type IV pilus assembly protein PilB
MNEKKKEDFIDLLSREYTLDSILQQTETREEKAEAPVLEDKGWVRAKELGLPYIRISTDQIDPELVKTIPEDLLRKNILVPYLRIANEMTIVMADPENTRVVEDIAKLTGCEVQIALGEPDEIFKAIDLAYGTKKEAAPSAPAPEPPAPEPPATACPELLCKAEQQKIVEDSSGETLLDIILTKALERQARVIFLRYLRSQVKVQIRTRTDIELLGQINLEWGRTLETRIGILSGITHGPEPRYQTGRFQHSVSGQIMEIQVSALQHLGGREIILNPLSPGEKIPELSEFNLSEKELTVLSETLSRRHGLVIVSGGRTSGMKEAAYGLLQRFDPLRHRVVTIEDRIELPVPEYVQIDTEGGIDKMPSWVARVLSHLDADVIFINNLLNPDLQALALHYAASGCLVIGGLPFDRMEQVLAYLSSLKPSEDLIPLVLQGLFKVVRVRTLCPECRRQEFQPQARGKGKDSEPDSYLPVGCPKCGRSGYAGWKFLGEFVPVSAPIQAAIRNRDPETKWEKTLDQKEYRNFLNKLKQELKNGNITREEAILYGLETPTSKT